MLQSKHSLERHKFFPFIAWVMVIGFSLFVYTIVQDLHRTSQELGQTASRLEAQLQVAPEEITDFTR